MKIGVEFPQTEIGNDPGRIRDFAETAEGLGYQFFQIRDHVLGADVSVRPGWTPPMKGRPPYNHKDTFHEVMVLFGYLAAVTKRMQLLTNIFVLPQRPTGLVAKQAAEVDVLSGGRLLLGVANGWNDAEFEALGFNYKNRASRLEEQIHVLRLFFTQELVTFHGKYHTINAMGLNPMPVQRPIPILVGGLTEVALRRAARIGDGFCAGPTATMKQYAKEAGRDVDKLLYMGSIGGPALKDMELAVKRAEAEQAAGTNFCGLQILDAGLTYEQKIDVMRKFAGATKHLMKA